MGKIKHRLLFIVLTTSAYVSPLLMVVALWTNYWLLSTERTVIPKDVDIAAFPRSLSTLTTAFRLSTESMLDLDSTILSSTTPKRLPTTTYNTFFPPTYKVYANYGLWESCKKTDKTQLDCEFIKYFQASDSENHLTDSIKSEIGRCLIIFLIACLFMSTSVLIHTYALIKRRVQYLFLISGCFFIFAGLFSLTGLIIFIAAVNGAVDSKLTLNNSKEEEPVFQYSYGVSFYCAVSSFLFQELNGICNIYWYMGHYRKHKLAKLTVQHKTNDSQLKYHNESVKRKPSLAKISRSLLGDSVVLDVEPAKEVPKIQINEAVEDLKSIKSGDSKTFSFLKTGSIRYKINKPEKHYITTFRSKAHLVKNLNRLNAGEKGHTKAAAVNMKQDHLVLKDLKFNGESSPGRKVPDSLSSSESTKYSSSSPASDSSLSSTSTPSSLSCETPDPSLLDSIDDTRHTKNHICPQKIKLLKKQIIQHNIGQKTNQIKEFSIDEDDIRAKFYKLDLDKNNSKQLAHSSAPFRPHQADYPGTNCNHRHHHHCCMNSPTAFGHTNYSNPIKLSQHLHQCQSSKPCIQTLNPSKSKSNLIQNKPYNTHNYLNSMAATNQHCLLREPNFSFKDICSNPVNTTDYAPVCPTAQELNYERQQPRVIHQKYAMMLPGSYTNKLEENNTYYTNSMNDITKSVHTPIKSTNNKSNRLPPYEALQHLTSCYPAPSNEHYPRVLPILKQQPVPLSMAAKNASQATQDYMIYRHLQRGNISVQMPNNTYAYYLSNTVPNLFLGEDTRYQTCMNYDVARGSQRLHRINRRIDYEAMAKSNREIDEKNVMPVGELVEERIGGGELVKGDAGVCSQRESRTICTQKNHKRTTSV